MKKIIPAWLTMLLAAIVVSCPAEVVSNLFADAGFEVISGNEPNAGTSPWFTEGEGNDLSFVSSTDEAYGGGKSVKYNYYYDDGAIVQNLDAEVDAGVDYEVSMWMLTAEPSGSTNHINPPARLFFV